MTDERPTIRAAVFDMDGVVTDTARAHFDAWKETFDAVLARHASGAAARPFAMPDYRARVDGVPRLDGVRGFLAARGIALPEGDPGDAAPGEASLDSVAGIAAAKNARFRAWLARTPVPAYADTLALIRALKARGIAVGIFSASRNAPAVLESAGVRDLFDVAVDGTAAREAGLAGKPAPDVLVETARRLGAGPDRTMVVEDAVSGVSAGRAGGFALVVGVDREDEAAGHGAALRAAGADIVTRDLSTLLADALLADDLLADASVPREPPPRG
ncbi:beta-phosphoglucomutase family hydrolase [Salinarimonas rosea]|uniref:beta-phosphoglucomutase family hydrolase n=1 Tax=Salinarimonas rosea TaxID=552063 RepID=UPI000429B1C4|nr:beta-phosphoglucomutase family hydrolase [Salinarimonas rosea]